MVTRIVVTDFKIEPKADHTIVHLSPDTDDAIDVVLPIVVAGGLGIELFHALAKSMPLLQAAIVDLNSKAQGLANLGKTP